MTGRFGPLALVVAASLAFVLVSRAARGDEPADAKKSALQWLDAYAVRQVLFHPKDVQKLREKVAAMSPAEAQDWWDKTAVRREMLDSPEWRDTERWLQEFLRVQAIYSDDEIRTLQAEAIGKAEESPRSLKEVMDSITEKRRRLAQGAQQSAEIRKEMLAARDAYQQDDVRRRESARRRTAASVPAAPPPPVRETRSRYNQPLVTSLDAARWSIVRDLYPRW